MPSESSSATRGLSRVGLSLLAAAAALAAQLGREEPRKKLIEFGWDEPSTAFLRAHSVEMERTPFDGCVYHADVAGASLAWQVWGRRAFREEELRPAFDDLRATRLVRFRSNFLRFNVTPGELDWYDDHSAVLSNARLAARLARAGRSAGILLDTEQYQGPLFEYPRQRDAGRRSFADYQAQARRRGRELMQAFEDGYPGLTLLLTFGHSYAFWQRPIYGRPLQTVPYGLLPAFVDGLIEGARRAVIVDGHEHSYWYQEPERFRAAYQLMHDGTLPIVRDPGAYRRTLSFGFGIWMDYYDWRHPKAWDVSDFSRNYFTPEQLYTALRAALETADEFVWLYSEQPRWWSTEGGPLRLPAAYDAAVRRAKADAPGRARRPR